MLTNLGMGYLFIKGGGAGLPKWDILFWVGPHKSDIIRYGWVGWSKKAQKIGYPLWMAPKVIICLECLATLPKIAKDLKNPTWDTNLHNQ